jgi:hypothetical protein
MKFLTIYVEFEICKLVVFASTHTIMSFACKGGLTLCDVLKFFSRPFPLTLCNVVELSFQSLPSTLQRKKFPSKKLEKKCSKCSKISRTHLPKFVTWQDFLGERTITYIFARFFDLRITKLVKNLHY